MESVLFFRILWVWGTLLIANNLIESLESFNVRRVNLKAIWIIKGADLLILILCSVSCFTDIVVVVMHPLVKMKIHLRYFMDQLVAAYACSNSVVNIAWKHEKMPKKSFLCKQASKYERMPSLPPLPPPHRFVDVLCATEPVFAVVTWASRYFKRLNRHSTAFLYLSLVSL